MAYYRRNNSGCGCNLFIIMLFFAAVVGGIRDIVNGDIKLPKIGSYRVSGGSGRIGTSNGYNVQYRTTTEPNYKSSNLDYSNTNDFPTEYQDGNSLQRTNSSVVSNANISSSMSNNDNLHTTSSVISNTINTSSMSNHYNSHTISSEIDYTLKNPSNIRNNSPRYETCSVCNGSGEQTSTYWYFGEDHSFGNSIIHCGYCNRIDTHSHQEQVTCMKCLGKGKVEVMETSLLGGEMEVPIIDLN